MNEVVKLLLKQPDKERDLRTRTEIRYTSTVPDPLKVFFDWEPWCLTGWRSQFVLTFNVVS